MTELADRDFFMDLSLVDDPYPYFEALRAHGPVVRLPAHNVVAVTNFDEAVGVYLDSDHYSSLNSITGPLPPLPFTPEGEDITEQIESHRRQIPFGEEVLTLDPPRHTPLRALMTRLFTPRRLKEMEASISRLADQLIDEFEECGRCELVRGYSTPFATLVIAELLGVPDEDQAEFRAKLGAPPSQVGAGGAVPVVNPLDFRKEKFLHYIEERRRTPRDDILSDIANATFPDGSTPEAMDVVHVSSLLFGAGQDTTAHLLGNAMRILAEQPVLQESLRADTGGIPAFIEEVLRFAGPVKASFRLARKPVTLAGVDIEPGTTIMLATAAVNRDAQRFADPGAFLPGGNQHLSFGRGAHTCPGAALARAEARISLERLLARLGDISIDPVQHGPESERRYSYATTYVFRALQELQLQFSAAA
jgi:cytochrome P450